MNSKYENVDMKCLVLLTSKGEEILIDHEDYDRVKIRKWSLTIHGYPVAHMKGKKAYLHRFIMSEYGEIDGKVIDHINGNKLDNRKTNLRVCNHAENNINKRKQKNNSSGAVGVYWNKRLKKWNVRVSAYGKEYDFGHYENKEDAIEARRIGEEKIQKEFAYRTSRQSTQLN